MRLVFFEWFLTDIWPWFKFWGWNAAIHFEDLPCHPWWIRLEKVGGETGNFFWFPIFLNGCRWALFSIFSEESSKLPASGVWSTMVQWHWPWFWAPILLPVPGESFDDTFRNRHKAMKVKSCLHCNRRKTKRSMIFCSLQSGQNGLDTLHGWSYIYHKVLLYHFRTYTRKWL